LKRLPAAFYELPSGRVPVRDWLKGLDRPDRKIIGEDIKDVEFKMKKEGRIGSSFDDFLREEGIYEEVTARAIKRVIARQLGVLMQEQGLSKSELAKRMATSRAQLDRLLDPENESVTLATLSRAAHAVGRNLRMELV
jgi:antitoxin HicB